ncbi:murein hydrolase activator EnvC family protein [Methyloradius palustris]|uniref:Peptidase M23 n=1 Tax=Methyloradius palustris TaxID=2778876 RepID=A0A8D5JMF3_9PROT|nr:peptidoglycan DD-metalloendopeptidase family protein [Methyloradius palustris]BCM25810.1 peptidase M23 [Methyloradius palustris]
MSDFLRHSCIAAIVFSLLVASGQVISAESTSTTKKTALQKSSSQDNKKQTTKKSDAKKDEGKKQVKKPAAEKAITQKKSSSSSKQSPAKQDPKKTDVEQPKETLSQIHARIEALSKELDTNTEAHADATDALKESEQSISETNRKLYELNQQQSQNRSSLTTLQQQKSQLESTIQQQKKLLGAQLYQQYLSGQQSYLQVLLQQQNPAAISRQLQYFTYVSQARAKAIASMQKNLGKVAQLNDQTADTLKQINDLKADEEQSRKALQAEKDSRSQLLKTLSAKIDAQRNEISKLKRDEKSLSDLVERLARAAAQAAAQAARKPKPTRPEPADNTKPEVAPTNQQPVARNDTLPIPGFDGGNFAALRGKLNLPVRGDVTNRFGASREDTGVSWKGLFIKAVEGAEVKSIASGRIVFADWMRGFGNLIIVDHGNGYMSLYGNNQALLKKAGDLVNSGDTIAAVGNTGGNQDNGLYYELRYQSKPLDPLSWSVAR